MGVKLYDHQVTALHRMKNGCILCGDVGSGKSRTAIAYYCYQNGGSPDSDDYYPMNDPPQDLYIITTARKRDTLEWEKELVPFLISSKKGIGLYQHQVVVDSWNNIRKYANVRNSFFIFDEQRVVGNGAWVKSFLKITKSNNWILLSATPGDTWTDYIPVFIANGFYKNRTEFNDEHIVYSHYTNFPRVAHYKNIGKLTKLRNSILVNMDFKRKTVLHHETIYTEYDVELYKQVGKTRWNPFTNEPVINAAGLCYLWRKITNSDISRQEALLRVLKICPKVIVFYNFDYELNILENIQYGPEVTVAEWNGHRHDALPNTRSWVYLVQYTAGSEGWNCIETNTMVFYSQNYSYKTMVQAAGRINRLNTRFEDLYYYHFKSRAPIDLAIAKALRAKKNFNESGFLKRC